MDISLVIMAAGIGSRFGGGIKQLEPVGPSGEIIMDYSIYDALKAGFNKIIFIIRKDLEKDFKDVIGNRIEKLVKVGYAYQELTDLPEGFTCPSDRKKPWGTGQAVLSIADKVDGPFAVINADDFYGSQVFDIIYKYITSAVYQKSDILDLCMGAYMLKNTLSKNGGVSRGICELGNDDILKSVKENYEIREENGKIVGLDANKKQLEFNYDQAVSMNIWGLPKEFLDELKAGFPKFLSSLDKSDIKSEYLLPSIIDMAIKENKVRVKALKTHDKWFGVTYKEDKEGVMDSIKKLISAGVYPEKLF